MEEGDVSPAELFYLLFAKKQSGPNFSELITSMRQHQATLLSVLTNDALFTRAD
ncbi:hypothetical protein [Mixta mediterraneensis]|uniref:hypothetical protein n=1 Tax=Mixta mediterraneensis TaxID=2758443 RepID=UPI001EEDBFFF|nr:hypothetical protein [Mixta mediterraneensis]